MGVQPAELPAVLGWRVGKSVLIVDDDEASVETLCELLSRADRFIFTAYCAEQAEKMLASRTFDLVLLDLSLPDAPGIELLRRYAKSQRASRFVALTDTESFATFLDAMDGDAYDFVRKPFSVDELRDCVTLWLESGYDADIKFHSMKPHWVEISIPCALQAVERARRFFWNLQCDLPDDFRDQFADCFRELTLNAVEWGGQFDVWKRVRIAYFRTEHQVQLRITDPGNGFSFDHLEHAAVGQTSDDPLAYATVRMKKGIRPGGLGLVIVRSFADELLFNQAQNEVILIKELPVA